MVSYTHMDSLVEKTKSLCRFSLMTQRIICLPTVHTSKLNILSSWFLLLSNWQTKECVCLHIRFVFNINCFEVRMLSFLCVSPSRLFFLLSLQNISFLLHFLVWLSFGLPYIVNLLHPIVILSCPMISLSFCLPWVTFIVVFSFVFSDERDQRKRRQKQRRKQTLRESSTKGFPTKMCCSCCWKIEINDESSRRSKRMQSSSFWQDLLLSFSSVSLPFCQSSSTRPALKQG